jgi:hypothetical protein
MERVVCVVWRADGIAAKMFTLFVCRANTLSVLIAVTKRDRAQIRKLRDLLKNLVVSERVMKSI